MKEEIIDQKKILIKKLSNNELPKKTHLKNAKNKNNDRKYKKGDWRVSLNDRFFMSRFFANKKRCQPKQNFIYHRPLNFYCNSLFDYIIEWPDHHEFKKQRMGKENKKILRCEYYGCMKSFTSMNGLKYHIEKKHDDKNDDKTCD